MTETAPAKKCARCGSPLKGPHLVRRRYDDGAQETFTALIESYGLCPVHLAEHFDGLAEEVETLRRDNATFYGRMRKKESELTWLDEEAGRLRVELDRAQRRLKAIGGRRTV